MENYIEAAIACSLRSLKETEGDVLVFLTGQDDIDTFLEKASLIEIKNILFVPCFAGLPLKQQMEVFNPAPFGFRKVVVSTNIAESSITIENITAVVDSCLVKMKFYNFATDSESLFVVPASQLSLSQRAGRAGRTRRFYLNSRQVLQTL